MESEKEKRIRERAYEIWMREGQPPGRHDEHWRQAEGEIAAESQSAGNAAAGNKPASDPAETARPAPAAPASPARRSRAASKSAPANRQRERKPGNSRAPPATLPRTSRNHRDHAAFVLPPSATGMET